MNTTEHNEINAYGTIWSQQYGACCPACGMYQKKSYKHSPWQKGHKTRYHRCQECGFNYKSLAIDPVAEEDRPYPEQLIHLRQYR